MKMTKAKPSLSKAKSRSKTKPKTQSKSATKASNTVRKRSSQATKITKLQLVNQEVLTVRRHWFGLIIIYAVCLFGLGLFVLLTLTLISDRTLADLSLLGVLLAIFILLLIFGGIHKIYTDNQLIINRLEVCQRQRTALFSTKISTLNLVDIEDVTVTRSGFFAHVLNYGTVTIETSGEQANFVFIYCPNPEDFIKILMQTRMQFTQDYNIVVD